MAQENFEQHFFQKTLPAVASGMVFLQHLLDAKWLWDYFVCLSKKKSVPTGSVIDFGYLKLIYNEGRLSIILSIVYFDSVATKYNKCENIYHVYGHTTLNTPDLIWKYLPYSLKGFQNICW